MLMVLKPNPTKSIPIHGNPKFLWISLEFLKISKKIKYCNGFLNISQDFEGFLWISGDFCGLVGVVKGFQGFLKVSEDF